MSSLNCLLLFVFVCIVLFYYKLILEIKGTKQNWNVQQFHTTLMFRKFFYSPQWKSFLIVSVVNIFLSYFMYGLYVFILRELFFFILLFFIYWCKENNIAFTNEEKQINEILIQEYPLLRFYDAIFVLFLFSLLFFNALMQDANGFLLYMFVVLPFWGLYFFLLVLKFYLIKTTPRLDPYFSITKSVKLRGWRSYGTAKVIAGNGLHVIKTATGLLAGEAVAEKLITMDPYHRSSVERFLCRYWFNADGAYQAEFHQAKWLADKQPEKIGDPLYFTKKKELTEYGQQYVLNNKMFKVRSEQYPIFGVKHHVSGPSITFPSISSITSWLTGRK